MLGLAQKPLPLAPERAAPHIQQTAGDMMIPADLGRILFSLLQQLHHLQLEFP